MFKCQQRGYTVGEIPIIFANRERGQSKISQTEIYKAMYTVARLFVSRLIRPKPMVQVSKLPPQIDDEGKRNFVEETLSP